MNDTSRFYRDDELLYPSIKTSLYEHQSHDPNNQNRPLTTVSEEGSDKEGSRRILKPSTLKDSANYGSRLDPSTSHDLNPRRLSFAEPPMTSSKRASLDGAAAERLQRRVRNWLIVLILFLKIIAPWFSANPDQNILSQTTDNNNKSAVFGTKKDHVFTFRTNSFRKTLELVSEFIEILKVKNAFW